jgi:ATP-dependent Clp protease ATP-binding subunit ClpA
MPTLSLLDPAKTGTQAENLEKKLRHLIIGQDEAIHQIVRTYQTFLAGLSPVSRPIGNFLFLGPTGSGKTRTVEATAEALVGNPRAVIKIDCGASRNPSPVESGSSRSAPYGQCEAQFPAL